MEPDDTWYSNPPNLGHIPFPFLFGQLPVERFHLEIRPENPHVPLFQYMGRESFATVLKAVNGFQIMVGTTRLYIQGTIGYGKSHLLAALAGLLCRTGKRQVFVPDCSQWLAKPLPYIQSALLCAYADPSSASIRAEIRAFGALADVERFCGERKSGELYFIIDQMNALGQGDPNQDMANNTLKTSLIHFLNRISVGHFRIISASANYNTARQRNEEVVSLMGGMSWVSDTSPFYNNPIYISDGNSGRDGPVVAPSPGHVAYRNE